MRVYMLRHGQAEPRTDHADDAARPLTQDGVAALRREAKVFKGLLPALDVIVTSPLVRAARTAEIVADAMGLGERVRRDERLRPGFSTESFRSIVRENESASAILLVGHEPDFSEIVADVVGGGRIVMKKGGLARIDLTDDSAHDGELVWLIPPAVLLGG